MEKFSKANNVRIAFMLIFISSITILFIVLFNEVGLKNLMTLSELGIWVTWWQAGMLSRIFLFTTLAGLFGFIWSSVLANRIKNKINK